jgi:hypothetical protein
MSKEETLLYFTDKESFNGFTSHVHDDAYAEFERFAQHFSETIKTAGPDTFHTTLSFFNSSREFIGVITCRDTEDKDDLYLAMSEMLHVPMSIASALFIVANDVRIRKVNKDTQQIDPDAPSQDALTVTYVTPDSCIIYTCPYDLDEDDNVIWNHSESFLSKIATSSDNLPIGDMVELFFIYSHTESVGAFSTEEILNYLSHKGFIYKIFNEENLSKKTKSIGFLI